MNILAQASGLTLPGQGGQSVTLPYPKNFNFASGTIGSVLATAIPFIFAFAIVGLLLMLVLGGFDFLTSGGDAKQLEQGKQRITYAIVGFLLIFVAFWLVQIVGTVFGLHSILDVFQ